MSNKGEYNQALDGISKLLDDETTNLEMQIELLILKSRITFRLGFFGFNVLQRTDRALDIINEVIQRVETQNNQQFSFQALVLKTRILANLIRWDEFLVEVEKVENMYQSIEKYNSVQQKFAQAKLFQLKGHIPLANTCTEDVDWDLEKSLNFLNEALSIFRDLNQHEEIVDVICDIVNNLILSSQITEIFTYANEGLQVAEQSGNHYLIAHSLLLIGSVHYDMSDYENTFYFAKRSLEIYEKIGDRGGILCAKNIIGLYYLKIESLEESKKIFQEIIDETPESLAALVNLSMVYDKEGRLTEALDLLNRSNKLYQNEKNKYYIQYPAFHISRIKIMQGELDEALIFLKQFLTSSQARRFKVGVSYVLSLISSIYWQKGLNKEAIE
ncbi:MAG: tetratricopeptide repeat protein, partial [Candidatus Heimdallarchaeota archaeon]|nr:tetratricopeptide repeat protein [Candidatus Heimdallarchaeota archaeon]